MTKAIAKKSGKEFTVVEMTEVNVLLRDEKGNEKEIKRTTLDRNYEVVETKMEEEIQAEEQAINESAMAVEENAQPKEEDTITVNDVTSAINASGKVEEVISLQIAEKECDIEIPQTLDESIRIRDNARQAYKENENRFRRTLADMEQTERRLESNPDNKYIKEDLAQCEVGLKKYVAKMQKYLKRYEVAKAVVDELRKAQAPEEDSAE